MRRSPLSVFSGVLYLVACAAVTLAGERREDWPNVGNDKAGTRYSTLDQVNRDNVGQLKLKHQDKINLACSGWTGIMVTTNNPSIADGSTARGVTGTAGVSQRIAFGALLTYIDHPR